MYKMIQRSVTALMLFASTLPSQSSASYVMAETTTLTVNQAAKGWRLAGAYRSYQAACRKADELEACGYETCIKKQGGYYCVYCR